jgi:hypothetical protein
MRVVTLSLAVLGSLLAATVAAAQPSPPNCVPTQATTGMIGCTTIANTISNSGDYIQIWSPGVFPDSARLILPNNLLSAPPPIGIVTPNSGAFTTLSANAATSLLGGGTLTGTFGGNPSFTGTPAFTGAPTSMTATFGTNTPQIATTAFVQAAVGGLTTGVSSVNTRTGAVVLSLSDIPGAAPLASPTFTGIPAGPTAAPGTNTTQFATTAFDTAAVLVETNRAETAEGLLAPKANPTFTGTVSTAALSASGTIGGAGFAAFLASPTGPIGATSPVAMTATTLTATTTSGGAGTFTSLTGGIFDYIAGLNLSNDSGTPNTVLDIGAGVATDSTNAVPIKLAAWTKTTGGTFVAGSANAGMGVGLSPIANSTWYHVFAIIVSGAADVYFDTSVTAVNKPTGTTAFRRIGSFLTNSSAQIIAFSQNGNEFFWATSTLDLNGIPLTTASLANLTVPPGVKVHALFQGTYGDSAASTGILFTSPDQTDQAPNLTGGAGVSLASPQASGAFASAGSFSVRTNTSGQIRYRATGTTSNSVRISTYGWVDTRGQQ